MSTLSNFENYLLDKNLILNIKNINIDCLKKTLKYSVFFCDFIKLYPYEFFKMINDNEFNIVNNNIDYYKIKIKFKTNSIINQDDFSKCLRLFRKQECLKFIYLQLSNKITDINSHALCEYISLGLSNLAIVITIETELFWRNYWKIKLKIIDEVPELIIITMGKMGAGELNFSSDIDLIFLYDSQENFKIESKDSYYSEKFYIKISQSIISCLNKTTANGFVYRVDLRLRPFGDGSSLVISSIGFEKYLLKNAVSWERYAYLKARIISGSDDHKKSIGIMINKFVYRNYQDHKMTNEIRLIKNKILKNNSNLNNNIKLGTGGIREIEFLTQCLQLIHGGEYKSLQIRNLKSALQSLENLEILNKTQSRNLYNCYVNMRLIENTLQMKSDMQTHDIPTNDSDIDDIYVILGFENTQNYFDFINVNRKITNNYFEKFIRINSIDMLKENNNVLIKATNNLNHETSSKNYNDVQINYFNKLNSLLDLNISEEKIHLLTNIINSLKNTVSRYDDIVEYLYLFLKSIMKKTNYLYLLSENSNNLKVWIDVLNLGLFFKDNLLKYPFLLQSIFSHNSKKKWTQSYFEGFLHDNIKAISLEDLIEQLRKFKILQSFLIAIEYQNKKITIMLQSDYLTLLAECIIKKIIEASWHEVLKKTTLKYNESKKIIDSVFFIAYGKLGGREMSYTSDIDLVLLFEPIENLKKRYHQLFAQKFYNLMTTKTYHGQLYDVDFRLRPDGQSSLIVANMNRFVKYQTSLAWVWEHQSLSRARFLFGLDKYHKFFNNLRFEILCKYHESDLLKKEVIKMREKLRCCKLKKTNKLEFDLKQDYGGMVDIEFLAQFFALSYTKKYDKISVFNDTIRLLESVETVGLISQEDSCVLIETYCVFRKILNELNLKVNQDMIASKDIFKQSNKIQKIYCKYLNYNKDES